MRKILLFVLFAAVAVAVHAQDTKNKASKNKKFQEKGKWKAGGLVDLAFSQAGSRNWAPGGDRFSLSGNAFLTIWAYQKRNRSTWENGLQLNYGLQNSRAFGIIKNDDRIDVVSKWRHLFGNKPTTKWGLGLWGGLRTQWYDGYDYDDNSGSEVPQRTRISGFFAPAVLIGSAGTQYKSNGLFAHIGLAARWVIVSNRSYELGRKYGVDPSEKVKSEWGLFSSLEYKKELVKNVSYEGRLDLASSMEELLKVDVFFTNMFRLKVNNRLGVFYNFDLQYDDDTRIFGYNKDKPDTQLKSIFGIGLSFKF